MSACPDLDALLEPQANDLLVESSQEVRNQIYRRDVADGVGGQRECLGSRAATHIQDLGLEPAGPHRRLRALQRGLVVAGAEPRQALVELDQQLDETFIFHWSRPRKTLDRLRGRIAQDET